MIVKVHFDRICDYAYCQRWKLLFRDGKGSRAALEGARGEHGGAAREQGGAVRSIEGMPRKERRSRTEADSVGAKNASIQFRLQLPLWMNHCITRHETGDKAFIFVRNLSDSKQKNDLAPRDTEVSERQRLLIYFRRIYTNIQGILL